MSALPPDGPDRTAGEPVGTATTAQVPPTRRHEDHGSGPEMGVVTPYGRPGVYIYPFWQRSEFWAMMLTALFIGIAAAVEDGFASQAAWTLITVLAASYIVSRGLAKREPREGDDDRPWSPGGGPSAPTGRFGRGVH